MAAKRSVKAKAPTEGKAKASAKAKAVAKANAPAKAKAVAKVPAKAKAQAETSVGTRGGLGPGDRAPSFELDDQSGARVSSSALAGKPYVLYFYPKDDTPGCTKEACDFRDAQASFSKRATRVFGVSPDSVKSHARFAEKFGLPFSLLADPERRLAEAYGVWVEKSMYGRKYMGIERSTFLVGADGRVKAVWRGVKVPGHAAAVLEAAS